MSDRSEKRKIEFIESYWTGGELGSDYQWSDNHGELIRCKDCKFGEKTKNGFKEDVVECQNKHLGLMGECHLPDWYCADGERAKTSHD